MGWNLWNIKMLYFLCEKRVYISNVNISQGKLILEWPNFLVFILFIHLFWNISVNIHIGLKATTAYHEPSPKDNHTKNIQKYSKGYPINERYCTPDPCLAFAYLTNLIITQLQHLMYNHIYIIRFIELIQLSTIFAVIV